MKTSLLSNKTSEEKESVLGPKEQLKMAQSPSSTLIRLNISQSDNGIFVGPPIHEQQSLKLPSIFQEKLTS